MQTSEEFWVEVAERNAALNALATEIALSYPYRAIKEALFVAQRDTAEGRADARYEAKENYWNREEAQ